MISRDQREIPDLLSGFGTYMVVITSAQSTKSKELLAYQTLIVREAWQCGGKGWLAYDTMFQQQVAGNPEVDWNPTLYAVTFLAQSGSGRKCVLYMESDYSKEDCALAKVKVGSLIPKMSSRQDTQQSGAEATSRLPKGKSRMVCFAWNQGECSFPYCRYQHTCIMCGGEYCIIHCHAWGTDWESWRKQGREPQSWDPQGRDPQGRQLAH